MLIRKCASKRAWSRQSQARVCGTCVTERMFSIMEKYLRGEGKGMQPWHAKIAKQGRATRYHGRRRRRHASTPPPPVSLTLSFNLSPLRQPASQLARKWPTFSFRVLSADRGTGRGRKLWRHFRSHVGLSLNPQPSI